MLGMDDKVGKAFWVFMGLDAILLLITSTFYFELTQRSTVTLVAAFIAFSSIFFAQVWMDSRQRRDHQLEIQKQENQHKHDWQRDKEAKLLEKQEEVIKLVLKVKSEVDTMKIIANGKIGLERDKLNKKSEEIGSADKESNEEINSSNKKMAEQFFDEYKLLIDDVFILSALLELYPFSNKEEMIKVCGELIPEIKLLKAIIIFIDANPVGLENKASHSNEILSKLETMLKNLTKYILNTPNDMLEPEPSKEAA
ncbi:hypothetical protein [uncultured Shewanella sp.]|uniref:hypothetical protein n=1 Tax=uncultured Shewanella sp. TaxID=173975 RepID=UPI00262568E0|nr:hypothetical protein [uncultured Shewanella sp.]